MLNAEPFTVASISMVDANGEPEGITEFPRRPESICSLQIKVSPSKNSLVVLSTEPEFK